jgi:glycerol-3-phosphate dehydrogenase
VTVTGGKLTTYRKMAQDTVDVVVNRLGESPRRRRCVTKSLPLLGATTRTRDPVTLAQPHARLLRRYGTASSEVLALADGRPELLEPVVAGLPYIGAEVLYAAREEMAGTLDDVLSRRTRATIQRAQPTMDAASAIATLIAPDMGWDEAETREQVARFTDACQKELLTAGLDLA